VVPDRGVMLVLIILAVVGCAVVWTWVVGDIYGWWN
jgi:hypothetical protein